MNERKTFFEKKKTLKYLSQPCTNSKTKKVSDFIIYNTRKYKDNILENGLIWLVKGFFIA